MAHQRVSRPGQLRDFVCPLGHVSTIPVERSLQQITCRYRVGARTECSRRARLAPEGGATSP